jgi:hypothetical protein
VSLDLVRCPACGGLLREAEEAALVCVGCEALYPIVDGIPSQQHVTSYLETAFRDWVWGENEIRETAEAVLPLIADSSEDDRGPGRVLVLGGGAGRFSLELSKTGAFASVTQLDLNPLLTRIGSLMARG